MDNFHKLTELEDAILRYVQSDSPTIMEILASFTSSTYPRTVVKDHIHSLEKIRNYINLSNEPYLKSDIFILDNPGGDDFEFVYEITALGKSYLARSTSTFTSFSNISNSNIAHLSPHPNQIVKIAEQPDDIQQKYKELQEAVSKRDSSAIKKAFEYIADKSVDVAIAILAQRAVR